jgi:hypothetical protein
VFRFTELSDSTHAEIDIDILEIEHTPDPLSPSGSSSVFGSPRSSLRDTDDGEILGHRIPSPPAHTADVDADDVLRIGASNDGVPNVPARTVRLMLPTHVHPAFPGCTPSTPATSQTVPQVSCQWIVRHWLRLFTGTFQLFGGCRTQLPGGSEDNKVSYCGQPRFAPATRRARTEHAPYGRVDGTEM